MIYDNSPEMVDDIVKSLMPSTEPAPSLQEQPQQPPAPDAPRPLDAGTEHLTPEGLPYGPNVSIAIERAAEAQGLDPAAISSTWLPVFRHHSVSSDEADMLVAAGQEIAANGRPDEATSEAWRRDAHEALAREYGGPDGAAHALQAAQAYCAKHPQLLTFLEKTGLGDHPRVVRVIANAATKAKKAGRLK